MPLEIVACHFTDGRVGTEVEREVGERQSIDGGTQPCPSHVLTCSTKPTRPGSVDFACDRMSNKRSCVRIPLAA